MGFVVPKINQEQDDAHKCQGKFIHHVIAEIQVTVGCVVQLRTYIL